MNRFDRILWRVNGIIILCGAVLGLALVGFATLSTFLGSREMHKAAAVVTEQQGSTEKESLNFGDAIPVTGSALIQLPLLSDVRYGRGSFSLKGGSDSFGARNFLFVNHQNLSSWWLFEGFHRLVRERHVLRAEMDRNETPIVGNIYEIAASDTDGDGRVTRNDDIAAYFASPDGKRVQELVPPCDRIISVRQVGNTEVLIVFQNDQATSAALFSALDGSKIKESTTTGAR